MRKTVLWTMAAALLGAGLAGGGCGGSMVVDRAGAIERRILAAHAIVGHKPRLAARHESFYVRMLKQYAAELERSGLAQAEVDRKVRALRRKVGLETEPEPTKAAPAGAVPLL